MSPNFALLDMSQPDVARPVAAMVQARDAVERRSWALPQEPAGEEWWADVLADPRARKRERRTDLAVKQAFEQIAQAISTQEVERRKESPAKAGLSLQEEPSNVTFTIDDYETSAAAALAM
jgi:hypothetical protein